MTSAAHPALELVRLSERPDLIEAAMDLNDRVWPTFVDSTDAGVRFWEALYTEFADCQFLALSDGQLLATGHTIPLWWDGTAEGLPVGWDDTLTQGTLRRRAGAAVNTLSALAATIDPAAQGRGLSPLLLAEMKAIAAELGLQALIAPVRPTLKSDHPTVPIEEYLDWRRADGQRYDPWVRTHERVGARLVKPAHRSMVVEGSLTDWEQWTQTDFDASAGQVLVPKGLVPVAISDCGQHAIYEEPNVWMVHPVEGAVVRPGRCVLPVGGR